MHLVHSPSLVPGIWPELIENNDKSSIGPRPGLLEFSYSPTYSAVLQMVSGQSKNASFIHPLIHSLNIG